MCVLEAVKATAAPGQPGETVDYHPDKEEQPVTVPWVLTQIHLSDETPDLALRLATFGHFCFSPFYHVCGCASALNHEILTFSVTAVCVS